MIALASLQNKSITRVVTRLLVNPYACAALAE
jgi:hypothetical protein